MENEGDDKNGSPSQKLCDLADAYVRKKSLQKLSIDDATSMGQPHAKRACLLRALSRDSYSLQQSKTLFGRVALPWLQVPRRKDRQMASEPRTVTSPSHGR